jgi:hypothetical protein
VWKNCSNLAGSKLTGLRLRVLTGTVLCGIHCQLTENIFIIFIVACTKGKQLMIVIRSRATEIIYSYYLNEANGF